MMLQIREKGNIREGRNGEKMMRWDFAQTHLVDSFTRRYLSTAMARRARIEA